MTSLVVPPLKKSLNDIIDEELYNIPNSPVNDSPKLNTTPLFNFINNANMYSNTNNSNISVLGDNSGNGDVSNNTNASNNDTLTDSAESYDYNPLNSANELDQKIFNDYGNPEQSFIQPNKLLKNYNPAPRRRLTTLDISSDQKMTDDYLSNPNIEPSSLFNFNEDSSIFVPPYSNSEILNDLNNYVEDNQFMSGVEDFDENLDDVSDDDDDENYFDDDYMVDNDNYNDIEYNLNDNSAISGSPDNNVTVDDKANGLMDDLNVGGFIDDYGIKRHNNTLVPRDDLEDNVDDVDPVIDEDNEEEPQDTMEFDEHNDDYDEEEGKDNSILDSADHEDKLERKIKIDHNNTNHQCHLLNSSTGQPCNKQFSRPYDLIRHQETIHASKKKIFRCIICEGRLDGGKGNGKSKTFSRGDALSRHIKVKHQLVGEDALKLINNAKENVEYVSVNS